MQKHLGSFLKEVVVNQGFTIKDFSEAYGTTSSHMSGIFSKNDIHSAIIRRIEPILGVNFQLNVEGMKQISLSTEQNVVNEQRRTREMGRPISFPDRKEDSSKKPSLVAGTDVLLKEIEGLKALLQSKDEVIKSKDELIKTLVSVRA